MTTNVNQPAFLFTSKLYKTLTKVTDKQFVKILTENFGDYSKTARSISKKYGVAYSRQATAERAKNFPNVNTDHVHPLLLNSAQSVLFDSLQSDNETVKLKAAQFVLTYLGNWSQQHDIKVTSDEPLFVVRADQTKEHQARVRAFEKKINNGLSDH